MPKPVREREVRRFGPGRQGREGVDDAGRAAAVAGRRVTWGVARAISEGRAVARGS
ncbi:hypothetical protein [Streptomyces natalensis]|uniref:hypothetical protein n=1 Tax=Streptomyces natalensis TaxID=68242 RepID=UPI000B1FD121|nr:hypothetical protein [Streptomyces natalensis]